MKMKLHRAIALAGCLLLLFPAFAAGMSQTSNDPARVERLADLCKLWGAIKYFHPYLAYRDIDWDAALVKAIPKVQAARTTDEYAAAVQSLLDALGDPATRVIRKEASQPTRVEPPPFSTKTEDGILIVTISKEDSDDYAGTNQKLIALIDELSKARGVVFDLRSGADVSFNFGMSGLNKKLSSTPVHAPGQRRRMHVGFTPQSGTTSGGYYSALYTADGEVFSPSGNIKDVRTVFLADEKSKVPPIALALQAAGKGAIVVEGSASDASAVVIYPIKLGDDLEIEVRVSELVYGDGTGGFEADLVVPASAVSGNENPAFKAALNLIRNPKKEAVTRSRLPARAAQPAERSYSEMAYPAVEYRLLAAFRIWTVINYFFPYKDLMGESWNEVLKQFIPRFEAAGNAQEYALTVAEMVTHVHDSHAFVVGPALLDYFGIAPPPVQARMIEGVPVVTGLLDEAAAKESGIEVGDVILKVDGEEAQTRIERLSRYIAASTPQSLMYNVMGRFLSGADNSTAVLTVRDRLGRVREISSLRKRQYVSRMRSQRHGEILMLLPGNIGYADLDRLPVTMVDQMFEMFKDTKAIVFDMRGYPNGTAWAIAPRLTEKISVEAARFQRPVLMSPEGEAVSLKAFTTSETFVQTTPITDKWRYKGKTVMLIDERAISQSEHTGLFFESANGTKFIGSHTAGANGDVTNFSVPGGIRIGFTGQSVRHADGRQLQRIGLVPDIEVKPTIAGIRAGKDEVLEKAIEFIEKEHKGARSKE
ncbi:MAG TPA: S41 family peptidase [Blastocatellia bacterium]|nr:S41 family peptidase [Blastocatellia bacterium]